MNSVQIILWSLTMITFFTACEMTKCGATKEVFMRNFDGFIEEVDDRDFEVSDDRWNRYDEKFRTYIEECYDAFEEDLTAQEKRQFWIKSLKYYALRYGEGMLNELSKDDIANTRMRNEIEEMLEESGKSLEEIVKRSTTELESIIEEMASDIEKWAERIKEIFEEK